MTFAGAIVKWCQNGAYFLDNARRLARYAISDTLAGLVAARSEDIVQSLQHAP
jgi:hypothetical protein